MNTVPFVGLVAINIAGLITAPAAEVDASDLLFTADAGNDDFVEAKHLRQKRSLGEFVKLLSDQLKPFEPNADKREQIAATEYLLYGNYCGLGAAGNCVDATDDCCFVQHKCHASNPSCSDSTEYQLTTPDLKCDGKKNDKCKQAICECDVAAAACFGKNRGTFDKNFIFNAEKAGVSAFAERKVASFKTDRKCPK